MNLREFLRLLRENRRLVLTPTLIGLMIGAALVLAQPKAYSATIKMFVSIGSAADVIELQQGSSFSEQRAATYADLATTPAVLDPVIDELELATRSSLLAQTITAESVYGTTLLEISAVDGDPERVAELADAVGESLTSVVTELENGDEGADSLVTLSVVQPAEVPERPVNEDLLPYSGIGAGAGLFLGVGGALLRRSLKEPMPEGASGPDRESAVPVAAATTSETEPRTREGRHVLLS